MTTLTAELAGLRRLAHRPLPSRAVAVARVRIKRRLRAAGWHVPAETPTVLLGQMVALQARIDAAKTARAAGGGRP